MKVSYYIRVSHNGCRPPYKDEKYRQPGRAVFGAYESFEEAQVMLQSPRDNLLVVPGSERILICVEIPVEEPCVTESTARK